MRETLRSYGHLRAINPEALTVEAVITTGNVARDQMVIDPAGWDFTNYRKNPVVLWSHNDLAVPIARTVGEVNTGPTELRATAEFDREDEEALRLFGKIKRGFVNATSVRWLPKRTEIRNLPVEGGGERETLVFVEQELLEWSFVVIPADPGAVILRANGSELDVDALLREARGEDRIKPPAEDARELTQAIHELITGDLDAETLGILRSLYVSLSPVVTERPVVTEPQSPSPEGRIAEQIERIAATLEGFQPIDVDGLIVSAIARATGRTEERVRAGLAGG